MDLKRPVVASDVDSCRVEGIAKTEGFAEFLQALTFRCCGDRRRWGDFGRHTVHNTACPSLAQHERLRDYNGNKPMLEHMA